MKPKTAEQVRHEFIQRGDSISAWAVSRGFNPSQVFNVLAGRNKGMRGKSHHIAVILGMKGGVIATGASKNNK